MSLLDADTPSLFIYYVLPSILICYVVWRFLCKKELFEAWIMYYVCKYIHRVLCVAEKQALLQGIGALKEKRNLDSLNILEIGVGGGLNLGHYPPGTRVTGLDPNGENKAILEREFQAHSDTIRSVKFVKGFAENMPEADSNSFDAVVCTLVLCTVQDMKAVLNEVHRVLKPGGVFFYLEHVAAERRSIIRCCQEWFHRPWFFFLGGCNLNRETWTFLDKSSFHEVEYKLFSSNAWAVFVLRPFMYGTATKRMQ